MITQKLLKEIVEYNPETGEFYRKKSAYSRTTKTIPVGTMCVAGYLKTRIIDKEYYLHRLAWLYVYGEFPKNNIDHINHKRSDNRIANLRDVHQSENAKNISLRADSTTRFNGVIFDKKRSKYKASIFVNKKLIHLGYFENIEIAIKVRQ